MVLRVFWRRAGSALYRARGTEFAVITSLLRAAAWPVEHEAEADRNRAVVALLVLGAVALFYRQAIAHGLSAREKPWAIEAFVARHLRRLTTARR